jgi:hypothetical protein
MLRDSKVDAKGHIKNKQDSKKQTKNKPETK